MSHKKRKKSKPLVIVIELLCLVVFLAAAGVFLYPFVTDYISSVRMENDIEEFKEFCKKNRVDTDASKTSSESSSASWEKQSSSTSKDTTKADLDGLYEALEKYNLELCQTGQGKITDKFEYEGFPIDPTKYGLPNGMIGYVTIPKLDMEYPLYLGASEENLYLGAAVMGYSSAPIGGESTNCVIAGHNYVEGAAKFKAIDTLVVGDEVILNNPWQSMKYRVVNHQVIEADDFEQVLICPGKDRITLFTCYYTDRGKLRYFVYLERVE